MISKIFPVSREKDMHHLLLFAIADERHQGWIRESYINYMLFESHFDNTVIIDFPDDFNYGLYRFADSFIHCSYKDFTDKADLLNKIIKNLEQDFHAYIWVDHFYIEGNAFYQRSHFVHPFLIYGYDNNDQMFCIVELDHMKGHVKRRISYTNILDAYFNGKEYLAFGGLSLKPEESVVFFRVNRFPCPYFFDIKRFSSELENYLYSRPNLSQERFQYIFNCEVFYGLSVNDRLIDVLKRVTEGKVIFGYTCLHRWVLHKKYLNNSLKYIYENFTVSGRFKRLMNKYARVVNICEEARLLNIKYNVRNSKTVNFLCKDTDYIRKLTETVKAVKKLEGKILRGILQELKSFYSRNKKALASRAPFYTSDRKNEMLWNNNLVIPNGISSDVRNSKKFLGKVIEYDNYLYTLNGNVDLDKNKIIKIRFRQDSGWPLSMIMFTTDKSRVASADKTVTFETSDKIREYIFDMSDRAEWTGKLDMFRFYPVRLEPNDPKMFESGEATVEIDSIIITDKV